MTTFRKLSLLCAAQAVLWPGAEVAAVESVSLLTWIVSALSLMLAAAFWVEDDE